MKRMFTLLITLILLATCLPTIVFADEDVQTAPAVFVVRSNSNRENKTDNQTIHDMMEELSGIDFEVVVVSEENWDEKINVMLASGEEFDTLNLTASSGRWAAYAENGSIQPWGDLLEQYAPHIMAMIPEEAWQSCKDANGSIWAIPRHESFTSGGVPSLRTDWLEILGMDMPTTLAELEAYFEGVMTTDMNGNGVTDDEIPYVPYYQSLYGPLHGYYLGTNGACDNDDHYLAEDGTVMPWYMHPNAYTMAAKAGEWYQKGYINQDYLTMTKNQCDDWCASDRVGMVSGWYNLGLPGCETLRTNNPGSAVDWSAIPNLLDEEGNTTVWTGNPTYMPELVLSSTSKNAKWALKLLDWIYTSEENYMLATYGIEGTHWNMVEGTRSFTQPEGATDGYLLEYQLLEWYDYSVNPEPYYAEDLSWRQWTAYKMRKEIANGITAVPRFDFYVPYNLIGTEAEFLTNDASDLMKEALQKVMTGEFTQDDWSNAVALAWETDGQIRSAIWTQQYHSFVGE